MHLLFIFIKRRKKLVGPYNVYISDILIATSAAKCSAKVGKNVHLLFVSTHKEKNQVPGKNWGLLSLKHHPNHMFL